MIPLPHAFLQRPIAHRGLHDLSQARPENSCGAINAAIAQGFAIELDLQLSADGQAIVFHDYQLARMTGQTGAVVSKTAAELGQIQLGETQHTIPTLTEALNLIAGQVPVLLELKDQDCPMGANLGPLEQAVAQALATYKGPVAMMSFNPNSVAAFAQLAPTIPIGITAEVPKWYEWPPQSRKNRKILREIPDYERLGCSFVSQNHSDLGSARIAALKSKGAAILCWTVRSPSQEAAARHWADNITFEGYLPSFPPA